MKILSVVGARPQFVKLAPVDAAVRDAGHQHVIVHTGQHYDHDMSDVFFAGLSIPDPDINLSIGSSSHGAQTGAMLTGLETVFLDEAPDWIVVYGDTNSTMAAALAAVKQHLRVAHVEAGLRSFNRSMPEEHNRVLTDHCADLLLAPTQVAVDHLRREGLEERTRLVGDVMVDVFQTVASAVRERPPALPAGLDAKDGFYLATIHRQESTDDPARLSAIVRAIADLEKPVLLAAHPRLRSKAADIGLDLDSGAIRTCAPLAYSDLVGALLASDGVVTDSGGLQKEAYFAGRTCSTIRTETEWVETLEGGWNVLVDDLDRLTEIVTRPTPTVEQSAPFGRGDAGRRVVAELRN